MLIDLLRAMALFVYRMNSKYKEQWESSGLFGNIDFMTWTRTSARCTFIHLAILGLLFDTAVTVEVIDAFSSRSYRLHDSGRMTHALWLRW